MKKLFGKSYKAIKSSRTFLLYLAFFISGALFTSFTQNKPGTQIQAFPIQNYDGFSLQYDSRNKIPLWTYEYLNRDSLHRVASRSSMHFQKDPSIYHLHQSSLKDYAKSGYDRAHMVPAADQQTSKKTLEKTFLLSNICPQTASLNRGLWAKLEQYTRAMALENREVEVITGPLFLSIQEGNKRYIKYQVIGENEVAVPTHFFKVINMQDQTIAYIVPNENIAASENLEQFQVPISTLERASGLHFQFK